MTEIERIARVWYTEQRGRMSGNTVAWDDLPRYKQLIIMDQVKSTLKTMEKSWQWR